VRSLLCFEKPEWVPGVKNNVICKSQDGFVPDMRFFDPSRPNFNPEYPEPVSPECGKMTPAGYAATCHYNGWDNSQSAGFSKPRCSEGKNIIGLFLDSGQPFIVQMKLMSLVKKPVGMTDGLFSYYQYVLQCKMRRHKRLFAYKTTISVGEITGAQSKQTGKATRFAPPETLSQEEMDFLAPSILAGMEQVKARNIETELDADF
jgi:hypothetical protein